MAFAKIYILFFAVVVKFVWVLGTPHKKLFEVNKELESLGFKTIGLCDSDDFKNTLT